MTTLPRSTLQRIPSIIEDEEAKCKWLDDLKFESYLGLGAFGIVVKATNKNDMSCSAVKIIFPEYSVDNPIETQQQKKKYFREFDNFKRVQEEHPNVVKLLNVAEAIFNHEDIEGMFEGLHLHNHVGTLFTRARQLSGDTICIQMELCGRTLRHWLNQTATKEADKVRVPIFQATIIKQLLQGLTFLHQHKIMHRDLKPENVYFALSNDEADNSYSFPIKIGDFGLSRLLPDSEQKSDLTLHVGTNDYKAPEVLLKEYGMQADLFSLGLVTFEVVELIKTKDRRGMFDRLVNDRNYSLLKEHPIVTNYREIVITLTKREVKDRLKSVDEVVLQLHENCRDYKKPGLTEEERLIAIRNTICQKVQKELEIILANPPNDLKSICDQVEHDAIQMFREERVRIGNKGLVDKHLGSLMDELKHVLNEFIQKYEKKDRPSSLPQVGSVVDQPTTEEHTALPVDNDKEGGSRLSKILREIQDLQFQVDQYDGTSDPSRYSKFEARVSLLHSKLDKLDCQTDSGLMFQRREASKQLFGIKRALDQKRVK